MVTHTYILYDFISWIIVNNFILILMRFNNMYMIFYVICLFYKYVLYLEKILR